MFIFKISLKFFEHLKEDDDQCADPVCLNRQTLQFLLFKRAYIEIIPITNNKTNYSTHPFICCRNDSSQIIQSWRAF
jgi:hypothetical protein